MIKILIIAIYFSYSIAHSQTSMRLQGESVDSAAKRSLVLSYIENIQIAKFNHAYNLKTKFENLNFGQLPEFNSIKELSKYFELIRDIKFLEDPKRSSLMKRRSSWMFPDNGCWIRAELMNFNMKKFSSRSMKKIFIFGKLKVETDFHPTGLVRWWYHVVTIARVKNESYVFDPAINPSRVLTLKEWALQQVDKLDQAKFSICHQNTYHPYSDCINASSLNIDTIKKSQSDFLNKERYRLISLGFNEDDYLGDFPPWKINLFFERNYLYE